jgi:hypothetical protein
MENSYTVIEYQRLGCLLRLAALYGGVRDTVAILIRRAVSLHRADLAALIAATR